MKTKPNTEISNIKLNEYLIKFFDNIMQQQNKMDNKAYIFTGFIIFIFNAFFKDNQAICFYSITLLITSIPLICSLLPVTTTLGIKLIKLYKQSDIKKKHNFFYYTDICHLSNDEFAKILAEEYDIKNLNLADNKLIEQIIINAEILNAKVIGHALFLWFIFFGIIACIIHYLINTP